VALHAALDRGEEAGTTAPHLALRFARRRGDRTELVARRVAYPWSLTRPFYLDTAPSGMATVIPQSCSGGLYRGDRLRQEISVGAGAAVHVATQGATLAHAATHSDGDGGESVSSWSFNLAEDALLEFVPAPLVLGGQAAVRQTIDATLAPGARLFLVDAWTWLETDGRPAFRHTRNEVRLSDSAGRLLALERSETTADGLERQRATVSAPIRALATAIIAGHAGTPPWPDQRAALTTTLASLPDCWTGVSELPNDSGLLLRAACANAEHLRAWTQSVWHAVRRLDHGAAPPSRRRGL
jgi:urease accessory protein